MQPKVFISHASEDRQRFVMAFAERLRQNGVDVWLDQWEMKAGDHLVERIFEQGLKNADAVVIVLSAASVDKPWVREELNVSVVKRIQEGLKIVPVVIDACEIPECLQATLWQRIDDLENYDDALQRILAALFDRSVRPPLGERPPRFAEPRLPGTTSTDERVLEAIYRHEVERAGDYLEIDLLAGVPALSQVPHEELRASFEILETQGLIHVEQLGPSLYARLTTEGFRLYSERYIEGYPELLGRAAALLVNEGVADNQSLAARIDRPVIYVNFLLDVLEAAGHLRTAKYGSGLWEIASIAPTLKRSLLAP